MNNGLIRVGLLAYGAIGHEHNIATQNTAGLVLMAVCDTNPERVAAALELAPNASTFSDATEMLDSGLLDLVVISTPPNSHFQWAKNHYHAAFMLCLRNQWRSLLISATS